MPPFWPFRRKPAVRDDIEVVAPRRQVHGREFAVGVPYGLPSDLGETNRLDFQHYVLRLAFKGNYASPIQSPLSILDVGTGTGRWAMDLATQFPQANVVGLDIKEPPADERNKSRQLADARPENYRFVAGNVLEGLPFADQSFDFVHQRLLFFGIPADKWPFVLAELRRVTRVGGWIEAAEGYFGYEPMGPATQKLVETAFAALQARGIDPRSGPVLKEYLAQAGLSNTEQWVAKLPVGAWGGRIGTLLATDLAEAHLAARPLVLSQGVSEAEWDVLRDTMRREWEQLHSTWPFYIAYGQRMV